MKELLVIKNGVLEKRVLCLRSDSFDWADSDEIFQTLFIVVLCVEVHAG